MKVTPEEYQALLSRNAKGATKAAPTKTKYGSRKTTFDGVEFDSAKEARRYSVLKIEQQQGMISNLSLQPKLPLWVNNVEICTYVGDFFYERDGKRVYEDCKSEVTKKLPVYRLKNKLVFACYGIEILET